MVHGETWDTEVRREIVALANQFDSNVLNGIASHAQHIQSLLLSLRDIDTLPESTRSAIIAFGTLAHSCRDMRRIQQGDFR